MKKLLCAVLILFTGQVAFAQAMQLKPRQVAVVILGKKILAKEFTNLTERQQRDKISNLIFGTLLTQYANKNKLQPTAEEIAQFSAGMVSKMQESERKWQQRKEELTAQMKSRVLDEPQKENIRKELEALEKVFADMPPASEEQFAGIGKNFVKSWKVNKSLYEKYGGRVIFQQAGPEPLDAYYKFLKEHEKKGSFKINDKYLSGLFWEYFTNDKMHNFYPAEEGKKVMQKPFWLMKEKSL